MNAEAAPGPPVRRRGFVEVRWRQFRRAPRPVVRAVAISLIAALLAGAVYLAVDLGTTPAGAATGSDPRPLLIALYTLVVLVAGAIGTYLLVDQPTGAGGRPRRSVWSAALGLFAALPIAYLVLVVYGQIIRPLLIG
jgi:hypothetical protein